jgi:hypothetical protein
MTDVVEVEIPTRTIVVSTPPSVVTVSTGLRGKEGIQGDEGPQGEPTPINVDGGYF